MVFLGSTLAGFANALLRRVQFGTFIELTWRCVTPEENISYFKKFYTYMSIMLSIFSEIKIIF